MNHMSQEIEHLSPKKVGPAWISLIKTEKLVELVGLECKKNILLEILLLKITIVK
jgi:hypothetical protein